MIRSVSCLMDVSNFTISPVFIFPNEEEEEEDDEGGGGGKLFGGLLLFVLVSTVFNPKASFIKLDFGRPFDDDVDEELVTRYEYLSSNK